MENKLTLSSRKVTSQYPVASDLYIAVSTYSGTMTISIAESGSSSPMVPTAIAILAVSPTEDDTYIYTF